MGFWSRTANAKHDSPAGRNSQWTVDSDFGPQFPVAGDYTSLIYQQQQRENERKRAELEEKSRFENMHMAAQFELMMRMQGTAFPFGR